MKSSENPFESFNDSLHYYTIRISPFLTNELFDEISKNPSNISKIMNKETYEGVTKYANYECEPSFNRVVIKIFLVKKGDGFIQSEKCFASHVLEQVFDEDDQLISEELKELI